MPEQLGLEEAVDGSNSEPRLAAIYVRNNENNRPKDITDAVSYAVGRLGYDQYDYDPLVDGYDSGTGRGGWDNEAIILFFDDPMNHPDELEETLVFIEQHEHTEDVIVPFLSTISNSWRDVEDVLSAFQEHEVTLHCYRDGLTIGAENHCARDIIEAVADAERRDASLTLNRLMKPGEGTGGRPPIGFTGNGKGGLRPAENFDEVRTALLRIDAGEMSLYEGSKITGHSRSALRAAINERRELYNLGKKN